MQVFLQNNRIYLLILFLRLGKGKRQNIRLLRILKRFQGYIITAKYCLIVIAKSKNVQKVYAN